MNVSRACGAGSWVGCRIALGMNHRTADDPVGQYPLWLVPPDDQCPTYRPSVKLTLARRVAEMVLATWNCGERTVLILPPGGCHALGAALGRLVRTRSPLPVSASLGRCHGERFSRTPIRLRCRRF